MKTFVKNNSIWLFVLILPILLGVWYSVNKKNLAAKDTIPYVIEGKTYNLLVADTPAEQEKGLMNVHKKDGFDGMIFKFPSEEYRIFWNMNTYVPLDLYWIRGGKVVGKTPLPSINETKEVKSVYSPEPADTVIEIIKD
jgi:uncharacterized membrane protein (UPF0127 family)